MEAFNIITNILLLAVGFSMDAFAVSICKGMAIKQVRIGQMAVVGAWFGGFQAMMPLIGYLLGTACARFIEPFDHWVAFVLLVLIGGNMLREVIFSHGEEEEESASLAPLSMLVLAVATSVDALAGGIDISIRYEEAYIAYIAVAAIGIITFLTCFGGVKLGAACGTRFKKKAEIAGGVILIGMGIKILVEHLIEQAA